MKPKQKRKAFKTAFILLSPLVVVANGAAISICLEMISASSDMSLFAGVAFLCIVGMINYLLLKLYKLKTTKQ